MITEYGDNLHVLFVPKVEEDWQTFGTWYSVNKNLPYASKSIIYRVEKQGIIPFQCFQWAKRLELPTIGLTDRKDEFLNLIVALYKTIKEFDKPILVMSPLHMATKPLTEDLLAIFNKDSKQLLWDEAGAGFCNLNAKELVLLWESYTSEKQKRVAESVKLVEEANEIETPKSLVSYKKGCGKWIDTKKGCPFASAGGLVSETMTVNEQKIVELWRKMVPLYSSIS